MQSGGDVGGERDASSCTQIRTHTNSQSVRQKKRLGDGSLSAALTSCSDGNATSSCAPFSAICYSSTLLPPASPLYNFVSLSLPLKRQRRGVWGGKELLRGDSVENRPTPPLHL